MTYDIAYHLLAYWFQTLHAIILTIHNIIVLNTLIMIEKTRTFPSLLPPSISSTIPANSPVPGSTYHECENWLQTYNTITYRNSLFFKGPMLYSIAGIIDRIDMSKIINLKYFKTKVKNLIFDCQNEGEGSEWEIDNFVLSKIKGLRSLSNRRKKEIVRYTHFY